MSDDKEMREQNFNRKCGYVSTDTMCFTEWRCDLRMRTSVKYSIAICIEPWYCCQNRWLNRSVEKSSCKARHRSSYVAYTMYHQGEKKETVWVGKHSRWILIIPVSPKRNLSDVIGNSSKTSWNIIDIVATDCSILLCNTT